MADKTMNIGNASTEIDVIATGKVVGSNLKSKGAVSQPVYFDANGVAQNTNIASFNVTNLNQLGTDFIQAIIDGKAVFVNYNDSANGMFNSFGPITYATSKKDNIIGFSANVVDTIDTTRFSHTMLYGNIDASTNTFVYGPGFSTYNFTIPSAAVTTGTLTNIANCTMGTYVLKKQHNMVSFYGSFTVTSATKNWVSLWRMPTGFIPSSCAAYIHCVNTSSAARIATAVNIRTDGYCQPVNFATWNVGDQIAFTTSYYVP